MVTCEVQGAVPDARSAVLQFIVCVRVCCVCVCVVLCVCVCVCVRVHTQVTVQLLYVKYVCKLRMIYRRGSLLRTYLLTTSELILSI